MFHTILHGSQSRTSACQDDHVDDSTLCTFKCTVSIFVSLLCEQSSNFLSYPFRFPASISVIVLDTINSIFFDVEWLASTLIIVPNILICLLYYWSFHRLSLFSVLIIITHNQRTTIVLRFTVMLMSIFPMVLYSRRKLRHSICSFITMEVINHRSTELQSLLTVNHYNSGIIATLVPSHIVPRVMSGDLHHETHTGLSVLQVGR